MKGTPKHMFELPILTALLQSSDGAEESATVIGRVMEVLKPQLTEHDRQWLTSGEGRARNTARQAFRELVQKGLARSGPRGVWRITDKGRETVQAADPAGRGAAKQPRQPERLRSDDIVRLRKLCHEMLRILNRLR